MPSERRLPRGLSWVGVAGLTMIVSLAFDVVGVPSPPLFAGLVVGFVVALSLPVTLRVSRPLRNGAQAVLGVLIGLLVDPAVLAELAGYWLPVTAVILATLGVSLLAGVAMGRQRGIDSTTGALAMVAGGATGLIAISRDLGADEQVVGVIQNLRVILIVVSMPLVAATVFDGAGGGGNVTSAVTPPGATWPVALLVTAACVAVGWPAGALVRLPTASLLGPMIVAAVAASSGLLPAVAVPALPADLAYALIGLSVGLGLTRAGLRVVARALPRATLLTVAVVAACAGLGFGLSAMTGVSPLEGYLATTPGGMSTVLATAVGAGAEVTFVLGVQVLRLLLMLATAPVLAHVLRRRAD